MSFARLLVLSLPGHLRKLSQTKGPYTENRALPGFAGLVVFDSSRRSGPQCLIYNLDAIGQSIDINIYGRNNEDLFEDGMFIEIIRIDAYPISLAVDWSDVFLLDR